METTGIKSIKSSENLTNLKREFEGIEKDEKKDESVFKPDKKPPKGEPRIISSSHFGEIKVVPGTGIGLPEGSENWSTQQKLNWQEQIIADQKVINAAGLNSIENPFA